MPREKRIEGMECRIDGCHNRRASKGRTKNGFRLYSGLCWNHREQYGQDNYKKIDNFIPCSMCGFIPVDKCQMDRDHINGNHRDSRPENIQVLCANCHRLKTKKTKKLS